jgi:hypothetical protein
MAVQTSIDEKGEETPMAEVPSWRIAGQMFDICKCRIPCTCHWAQPPTEGDCDGVLCWRIEEGRFGDVALDGLTVVLLVHFEGSVWDGAPVEAGVLMDERADERQREALGAVFSGQAGGWPSVFPPNPQPPRGVEFVPIDWEVADDLGYWRCEIPGKVTARGETLTGPTMSEGERVQVHNLPGSGVGPGQVVTYGKASANSVEGFGFKWEWDGRSALHQRFDWSGPEVP